MSTIYNQYLDKDAGIVICEPASASQNNKTQSKPYYSVEEVRRKARILRAKTEQRKREGLDGPELSEADRKAWWGYLKEKHPANYKRANLRLSGKDTNLAGICSPDTINVNDYFELYNLPRITAKNHEIRVNGELVAEYRYDSDYRKVRDIFEQATGDDRFKDWKREQFFVSQKGKCAWCEKPTKFYGSHVDHVQPVVFFGENDPSNFVVSCPTCNIKKSAMRIGWNGRKGDRNKTAPNAIPVWIGENKRWSECRAAIAKATEDIENGKV